MMSPHLRRIVSRSRQLPSAVHERSRADRDRSHVITTISIVCHHIRRTRVHLTLAVIAAIVFAGHGSGRPDVVEAQARTGCAAAANPIVCENALPGHTDGHIIGVGDTSIQGFATDISVNIGATVDFKIKTDVEQLQRIDIYRLGYYGGAGARKVATLHADADLRSPPASTEPATGLSIAATGRSRRRGPCRRARSRASTSRKLDAARLIGRREPHRLRRARRRAPGRRAVADLGHDVAGLQPLRRRQPVLRDSRTASRRTPASA